jgi:hypothetical protein
MPVVTATAADCAGCGGRDGGGVRGGQPGAPPLPPILPPLPHPQLVPVHPLPRPAPPPAPPAMIKKQAVVMFCCASDLFKFLFNLVVKSMKKISTWYSKIVMIHSERCSILKTVSIKMHIYVRLQFRRPNVHVFVI